MDFGSLPLPLVRLVDLACDRFESEWRAGGRPAIEQFLVEPAGPERPSLLRALIVLELEFRRDRWETPTDEEYAARFPGWADVVSAAFEDRGDSMVTVDRAPAGVEGSPAVGSPDGRRFRVLRPHAAGGLGEVSIAHDSELNREVALKTIRDRHADDPSSRRRFLLEAEVTGSLEHPGIVPVYSLGLDGAGPALLRDAVRPRGDPQASHLSLSLARRSWRGPGSPVAGPPAAARPVRLGVQRRRLRPQPGRDPPRPQAGERHARPVRRDPGRRLGPGQIDPMRGRGREHRPGATPSRPRGLVRDPGRGPARHAPVHEPRAGVRPARTRWAAQRRLRPGCHPLPPPDRPAGIRRRRRFDAGRRPGGQLPAPRQVEPGVPRGLEAACLKAMAARPEDRYATTDALARDVERWLADEPVSAYREPRPARAARWLRKHRSWALAGTVALALTAAVSALSAFKVARANQDLVRANRSADMEFDLAMSAIEQFYTGTSQDLLLKQPQFAALRRQLLATPRMFYQDLKKGLEEDPDRSPEALGKLARAFLGLARLSASLGDKKGAIAALMSAIEVNEARCRSRPSDARARSDLAQSLGYLGDQYLEAVEISEAEGSYRRSHAIREALCEEGPGDPDLKFQFARSHRNFGRLSGVMGRTDDAIGSYEKARRIEEDLVRLEPHEPRYLFDLARSSENIGQLHRESGRLADSEEILRVALGQYRRLVDQSPGPKEYLDGLASCQTALGIVLQEAGRPGQGRRFADEAEDTFAKIGPEVMIAEFQHQRALNLDNLGRLDLAAGQLPRALENFRLAVEVQSRLVEVDPDHRVYQHSLGVMHEGLGQVLSAQGERREALGQFGQAIDRLGAAVAKNPRVASYRRSLARAAGRLGLTSTGSEPSAEHAALFAKVAGVLAECSAATVAIGQGSGGNPGSESRIYADGAVTSLRLAIAAGFHDLDQIRIDPRFQALRPREDLRKLLDMGPRPSAVGPESE